MKKITLILKRTFLSVLCTGMMGIISGNAWAQPIVVQVPSNCQVVVPGVGGNITTGIVGNGGIVIMPDPYDLSNAGVFTIDPQGATLLSYTLAGDLSFTNNTLDQSETPTTSPIPIYSYNKNRRLSSEGVSPSSIDLARSKGRVYISYDATPCGGGISFDVYKTYSYNPSNFPNEYVPPIIGPKCWLPDSTYTYSVDQIASDNLGDGIGIDMYYWKIEDVNSVLIYDSEALPILYPNSYTSADKSSITTKVPTTLESPYTITCCFGQANDWGSPYTTCVQLTIGAEPAQPLVIFPECVPIGAVNFVAEIDLINPNPNYNPAFTYSWSSNNPAWVFTPSSGISTVVTDLGEGPGKVILSAENPACSTVKEFEFQVNRSFQAPEVEISGPSCIVPNADYVFSIQPTGVQANNTQWTLPSGWTIVSSNGTNTIITVNVPNGTPVGSYSISAASAVVACSSTSVNMNVYIKPENPIFETIGTSPECVDYNASATVNYTVSSSTGATGYAWTFPSTWTPPSTTTIVPTVDVTPVGDGTTSGMVSVIALGYGTCNSDVVNYPISYNTVKPDNIPAVCWNYGLPGTTAIVVDNTPSPFFGTYVVSTNPTGLIDTYLVDPITGVITINTLETAAGNYDLIIEHNTGITCLPKSETFQISVVNNGTSIFPFYNQGMADTYFATTPSGSTFMWTLLDGSGNVISHPTPSSPGVLTLSGISTPPAQVCIDATVGGCTTRYCVSGGVYSESIIYPGNNNTQRLNENIKVYPNPNKGTFNVFLTHIEKTAELQLFDTQGRLIKKHTLSNGENTITENISEGTYLLLINVDGEFSTHKIEINSVE